MLDFDFKPSDPPLISVLSNIVELSRRVRNRLTDMVSLWLSRSYSRLSPCEKTCASSLCALVALGLETFCISSIGTCISVLTTTWIRMYYMRANRQRRTQTHKSAREWQNKQAAFSAMEMFLNSVGTKWLFNNHNNLCHRQAKNASVEIHRNRPICCHNVVESNSRDTLRLSFPWRPLWSHVLQVSLFPICLVKTTRRL